MVLQFITEVLSPYFENRILNAVLGKRQNSALIITKFPADNIVEVEPTIFKVPSKTKANVTYDVDISTGMCSCENGSCGKLCQHQESVIVHRLLCACQVFQGSADEKYRFACIAIVQKNAPNYSFFEKIAFKTSANSATQQSYKLQEHEKDLEGVVKKEIMEVCELRKEQGTEMKSTEDCIAFGQKKAPNYNFFEKEAFETSAGSATHDSHKLQEHENEVEDGVNKEIMEVCELL